MPDELDMMLASWTRSLRAANKADRTVQTYLRAGRKLAVWLREDPARPDRFQDVSRRDLEGFFAGMLTRVSAGTAAIDYRSLQQLFKWLWLDEEEVDATPFARMSAPIVPEQPVPVIPAEDVRRLLATCKVAKRVDLRKQDRERFEARRDEALIRLLYDTGVRASEVLGIAVGDVDLDAAVILVHGKGRKDRTIPFGAKTARAMDRYLRVRSKHAHHSSPVFWLGRQGPLGYSGLRFMLNRRAKMAGLSNYHPHQFRHSFAHEWLSNDGNEGDLQRLAGWSSRQMLKRYGESKAGRSQPVGASAAFISA